MTQGISKIIKSGAAVPAACLALAITATALAPAADAATAPRYGISVLLLDHGPAGAPSYGRPDTYIGTTDEGMLPAPIKAGTSATYTMEVVNTGNVPETLAIYSAPATMTKGAWLAQNTGKNTASSWITPSAKSAVLQPGRSFTTAVRVTVPARTARGTYYAVVWAGLMLKRVSGRLTLGINAGIRAYLTVVS
jgi:hypothetical protein